MLGILGRFLLSAGVVLACFVGVRSLRTAVDEQVVRDSNYVLIANTPAFDLPPATPLSTITPLPTITPSPTPTASPPPLPAIRVSIPAIGLNSNIEEIQPTEKIASNGATTFVWEVLPFVVAHYGTSGNPGEGRNIVLTGHNNTQGEVFRRLDQLRLGDPVTLYTEEQTFEYQVQKKLIIPYLGAEEDGNAMLRSYAAPQSSEMVTLISCWPYATNANRIVIIAVPVSQAEAHAD